MNCTICKAFGVKRRGPGQGSGPRRRDAPARTPGSHACPSADSAAKEHEAVPDSLYRDPAFRGALESIRRWRESHPAYATVFRICSDDMTSNICGMSRPGFCDEMSTLRSDIQISGGAASNPSPDILTTIVFSRGSGFHTYRVTKVHRTVLHELDGKPAFHVYQQFLHIEKNDRLVSNTLEFPLFMDQGSVDVLRCPLGANDDDSLNLAAEVTENTDARLACGDPETILRGPTHEEKEQDDPAPFV